jgi:alpha-ketoglutarate-dependent taurine dioxygenase
MPETRTLKLEKATPTVGAEVLDIDVDRLLTDPAMPPAVMEAVEEHGALLFRQLDIDDESQAAFFSRLGDVVKFPNYAIPEVMVISLDPDNPNAEYFKGNVQWHIDGTIDQSMPAKASILTAHRVSPEGGETEFVSTYAAYDALSDDEKERFSRLRVLHSMEAVQRGVTPDPTPEQLANWKQRGGTEHPLVWTHESGRKSLVLGATADCIVGMDRDQGRALLEDLLERATRPELVFEHTWEVGDTVMWDNTGTLHRAMPFDPASRREMHRTTIVGNEVIR